MVRTAVADLVLAPGGEAEQQAVIARPLQREARQRAHLDARGHQPRSRAFCSAAPSLKRAISCMPPGGTSAVSTAASCRASAVAR